MAGRWAVNRPPIDSLKIDTARPRLFRGERAGGQAGPVIEEGCDDTRPVVADKTRKRYFRRCDQHCVALADFFDLRRGSRKDMIIPSQLEPAYFLTPGCESIGVGEPYTHGTRRAGRLQKFR